jgi:hypothetical protein
MAEHNQNQPHRCSEDLRTSTLPPAQQQANICVTPRPPAEQYDIDDDKGDDDDEETRDDHERTGPAYAFQRPKISAKMIDTHAQIGRRGGRRADDDAFRHEDNEGDDDENALASHIRLQRARALPEHDASNASSGGSKSKPGDDDDDYVLQCSSEDLRTATLLDLEEHNNVDIIVRLARKEIDEAKFGEDEADYAEIQDHRQENIVRFPKFEHTEMHFIVELTPGRENRRAITINSDASRKTGQHDTFGTDDEKQGDDDDFGQYDNDRTAPIYACRRPKPNPKVIGSQANKKCRSS